MVMKMAEMVPVEARMVEDTAEATKAEITAEGPAEVPAEAEPSASEVTPSIPAVAPSEITASRSTQARSPSDLIEPNNTYTGWSVNIRVTKHILSKPYQSSFSTGPSTPIPPAGPPNTTKSISSPSSPNRLKRPVLNLGMTTRMILRLLVYEEVARQGGMRGRLEWRRVEMLQEATSAEGSDSEFSIPFLGAHRPLGG